jgi:hypothetical protein
VTDGGLVYLKGLKDLLTLDVRHTKVTDAALEELKIAIPALNFDRTVEDDE